MARAAQSASLHILQGNPNNIDKKELHKRMKNEEKLSVGSDHIDPPAWLNEQARQNFFVVKTTIIGTGLITDADVDLIAAYATTLADLQDIEDELNSNERYVESATDGMKVNGLLKEKRNIIKQLTSLQNELALTPRARASLAIAMNGEDEGEGDDEFDD